MLSRFDTIPECHRQIDGQNCSQYRVLRADARSKYTYFVQKSTFTPIATFSSGVNTVGVFVGLCQYTVNSPINA